MPDITEEWGVRNRPKQRWSDTSLAGNESLWTQPEHPQLREVTAEPHKGTNQNAWERTQTRKQGKWENINWEMNQGSSTSYEIIMLFRLPWNLKFNYSRNPRAAFRMQGSSHNINVRTKKNETIARHCNSKCYWLSAEPQRFQLSWQVWILHLDARFSYFATHSRAWH